MLLQASNVFVSASCGAAALQALAPAATLGLQRLLPLSAARRAPAASHGPRAAAWAPPPAYAAFAARQASSNATPSGPARPFSSEAQPSAMPALAAAPALALPPRIKGIGRKMLLRQVRARAVPHRSTAEPAPAAHSAGPRTRVKRSTAGRETIPAKTRPRNMGRRPPHLTSLTSPPLPAPRSTVQS